ncbi:hypothetical protein AAL_02749 [Moelleriella libera RCEF 2490]|uniref:Uncharacterized protein n=1 Tax=Moelleriella libera RCEF 2490 TaxID=1081109 RepID=A0A168EVV5_9HYPO|nr:hypothetical protein AAL_02749 [Moelleriella libera RCEF 2490]
MMPEKKYPNMALTTLDVEKQLITAKPDGADSESTWNREDLENPQCDPRSFTAMLFRYLLPPGYLPILQHRSIGTGKV